MSVQNMLLYKIAAIHRQAGGTVSRLCEEHYGITRREFRIISFLALHGQLPSSEIARLAELERTRASRVLVTLHDKQLIQRIHKTSDHRVVYYDLTAQGHCIYQALMPQIKKINADILAALSPDLASSLMQALDAVIAISKNK